MMDLHHSGLSPVLVLVIMSLQIGGLLSFTIVTLCVYFLVSIEERFKEKM